jgi:hypothetical protein
MWIRNLLINLKEIRPSYFDRNKNIIENYNELKRTTMKLKCLNLILICFVIFIKIMYNIFVYNSMKFWKYSHRFDAINRNESDFSVLSNNLKNYSNINSNNINFQVFQSYSWVELNTKFW